MNLLIVLKYTPEQNVKEKLNKISLKEPESTENSYIIELTFLYVNIWDK